MFAVNLLTSMKITEEVKTLVRRSYGCFLREARNNYDNVNRRSETNCKSFNLGGRKDGARVGVSSRTDGQTNGRKLARLTCPC